MSLKERMEQLAAEADKVMKEFNERQVANVATLHAELLRRGYDVEGKSVEEIKEILKHPPTKPEQP